MPHFDQCYLVFPRLAKLVFQREPSLCVQRRKSSSGRTTLSASQLHCSPQLEKENNALNVVTCSDSLENISLKQGEFQSACVSVFYVCADLSLIMNKRFLCCPFPCCSGSKRTHSLVCLPTGPEESARCFFSHSTREILHTTSSLSSSFSSLSNLKCEKHQEHQSTQTELTEPLNGNPKEQYLQESSSQNVESSELQLEYLATRLIKNVLNNALNVVDGQSQANISDCLSKLRDQTNCISKEKSCECKVCQRSAVGGRDTLKEKEEKVQVGESGKEVDEKTDWGKENREVGSRGPGQENMPDICCHGACWHDNRPSLDNFKEFLQGTPGEKLINLWMDIEKLKIIEHSERKGR